MGKKIKKKKILFVVGWPLNQGGHIASLYSFVKLLRKDFTIFIIAPYGKKQTDFEKLKVRVINTLIAPKNNIGKIILFFQMSFLVKRFHIDIVNPFDYASLLSGVLLKLITNKAVGYTKAGGEAPKYKLPPIDFLVVFSRELESYFKQEEADIVKRMYLIKERIDTDFYKPSSNLFNFYESNAKRIRLFMAMRVEPQKKAWLDNVFYNLEKLSEDNINFEFTLAGDGSLASFYKQKAEHLKLSERVNFVGEISDNNVIRDYYLKSDLVIGHGRGVLEAMSCNKTCIIIGKNGEAALISPENINTIEKYNFSGRHFNIVNTNDNLYTIIKRLLYSNSIIHLGKGFNRKYILENYDSKIGYAKLKQIYLSFDSSKINKRKVMYWFFNLIKVKYR